MNGFTAMGVLFFLALLLGRIDFRKFQLRHFIVAIAGLLLLTGPLADIGTAMVIVRNERETVSATRLISKTFDAFENKRQLEIYKIAIANTTSDWDEKYFDNIFLSRFCNLKYNDEGLKQYNRIGHVDPKMTEYSINKFWSVLPSPILKVLQVKVDKESTINASFGDHLYTRASGNNGLGGFRTGSSRVQVWRHLDGGIS